MLIDGPGCRVTIGGNMEDQDRISVLHPLQLLDWALSGKGPEEFVNIDHNVT